MGVKGAGKGNKYPTRGLGSMTPERRKEISSLGGIAGHKKADGRSHEWTSETARIAGRLGGLRSAVVRRKRAEQEF